MDFALTPEQAKLREEFFEVCKGLHAQAPPSFMGHESQYTSDEGWQFHLHCTREFAKRGWLALGWPAEYGGKGNIMDRVMFAEARGYYDVPGVDAFGVRMLAPTLLQAANDDVKKRFLPTIASGEVMWCETWSEPNAGSDLASLTSVAVKKGDEYIINGQKIWTTGAHRADWGFGVFKTSATAPKHHNLSFLLFDMKTPGVTVRPIQFMNGANFFCEVYFDDVHVPADQIVGKENEGWAVVNVLAGFERSGADQIMAMLHGLELLVDYCNKTERSGVPLAKDPVIRNRLAQVACELEAARSLAYRVADLQNRSEMSLMDAAAVKIFTGELAERFSALATEVLGPYGQVKYSKWAAVKGLFELMYQECFVYSISMGTNEIQKNIIAWYGLGLPRMK